RRSCAALRTVTGSGELDGLTSPAVGFSGRAGGATTASFPAPAWGGPAASCAAAAVATRQPKTHASRPTWVESMTEAPPCGLKEVVTRHSDEARDEGRGPRENGATLLDAGGRSGMGSRRGR